MAPFNQFTNPVERLIHDLAREVYEGRAHLYIGRHLTNALIRSPHVAKIAPTFFSLAIHAHMVEAFLHLARLFDKRANVVKLSTLLDRACDHAGHFKNATAPEVRQLIARLRPTLAGLAADAAPVRERRNKLLAHLDPHAMNNLEVFEKAGKITFGEMETLYSQSGRIVNQVYRAYNNEEISIDVIGTDDFESLLRVVEGGRKAEMEELQQKRTPSRSSRELPSFSPRQEEHPALRSLKDRLAQLREVAGGIEAELGRIRHHLLLHKKAPALTWVGVRNRMAGKALFLSPYPSWRGGSDGG